MLGANQQLVTICICRSQITSQLFGCCRWMLDVICYICIFSFRFVKNQCSGFRNCFTFCHVGAFCSWVNDMKIAYDKMPYRDLYSIAIIHDILSLLESCVISFLYIKLIWCIQSAFRKVISIINCRNKTLELPNILNVKGF